MLAGSPGQVWVVVLSELLTVGVGIRVTKVSKRANQGKDHSLGTASWAVHMCTVIQVYRRVALLLGRPKTIEFEYILKYLI